MCIYFWRILVFRFEGSWYFRDKNKIFIQLLHFFIFYNPFLPGSGRSNMHLELFQLEWRQIFIFIMVVWIKVVFIIFYCRGGFHLFHEFIQKRIWTLFFCQIYKIKLNFWESFAVPWTWGGWWLFLISIIFPLLLLSFHIIKNGVESANRSANTWTHLLPIRTLKGKCFGFGRIGMVEVQTNRGLNGVNKGDFELMKHDCSCCCSFVLGDNKLASIESENRVYFLD